MSRYIMASRGEAYNVAGENQQHNIDVIHRMLDLLGKPASLIKHVPDREGHDRRIRHEL